MKKPKPELSSDYNASLPDWPKNPVPPPNRGSRPPFYFFGRRLSLSSRNTIGFLVILGLGLLLALAYAVGR